MRCHSLIPLLLCIPAMAHAKPDCEKAIATPDVNACARTEFEAIEKKLNDTYRQVLKSLNKPDERGVSYSKIRKDLVGAQKAWVVFRQKDCDAVFTFHAGGTIRTAMYLGCMQRHAENRIKDLAAYEAR
jgi:uncharacterized protein YecT (DUF1311 family)